MVSRRNLLLGGMGAAAAAAQEAKRQKMNFIFYMPETMRAESLGCYGHPLVKTPNFDRFAGQGTRFNQCHVQNTVCAPSRCSLMTGWPVHVRGHRSLYYLLHADEPSLFRYIKQAGYDVYWNGKNDLYSPDAFAGSVTDWNPHPSRRPQASNPFAKTDPHFYSFLYAEGGDRKDTADYDNVQTAIRQMEQATKPFCLYLPLTYSHPPFTAPKDFYNMYDPAKLPALRPPGLAHRPNFHQEIRRTRHLDALNDADFRKIQAVYLGMISYSDWIFGELLSAVERSGHADDTAIFVFSDHGEWGGDYGLVEKWPSAMEDVLTRIPLLARVPGMKAGHVSAEMVELFDVMPTVLELAGVEANHTHFARSLMPQLRGELGDPARPAFCEGGYNRNEPQDFEPLAEFGNPDNIYYPKVKLQNEHPETITRSTMVRTLEHKLISRPDGQSEFYDLRQDPRELNNLFGEKSQASHQAAMEKRMLDWYIRTADVAPKQRDARGFPARTRP